MAKEKKEKGKVRIWIENIIEILIVIVCLVFSIVTIANPGGVKEDYSKISVSWMPVLSESMSGTFEKGDLIFGEKIGRDSEGKVNEILDINDVAIFIVNDPKLSEYQYINTHRVVGYYYEYTEDGKSYAGYDRLLGEESVTDAESASAFATSLGWTEFNITGYVTSGDNKSIYYVDGDITGELIKPSNTALIDDYFPSIQGVIGRWNGKKISGLGGVITWMKQPTNFFFVVICPLVVLFGYNVWVIIQYVLEVKTAKARKLAYEEALANGISKEDEEEIKRKAIEEYLKKLEQEKEDKKDE